MAITIKINLQSQFQAFANKLKVNYAKIDGSNVGKAADGTDATPARWNIDATSAGKLTNSFNITLKSGNNKGTAVAVDGSNAVELPLPANIDSKAKSAGTADKLATARSIWGQSFDGSGDVNGNLTIKASASDTSAGSVLSYDGDKTALKVSTSLYSQGAISAIGADPSADGVAGSRDNLTNWDNYNEPSAKTTSLSAELGKDLNDRLTALETNGAAEFTTTGAGNVVTAVTKEGNQVTVTKGITAAEDSAVVHKTGNETVAGIKTFSGSVKVPTVTADTEYTTGSTNAASTAFVKEAIDKKFNANDAMVFKGVIDSNNSLPKTQFSAGYAYKVGTAGTYAGQEAHVGDLIIAIKDNEGSTSVTPSSTYWSVFHTNNDGNVSGPASSTADHIVTFSDATGKVIKDSGFTIATSVPANAVFTDTKVTNAENHYAPSAVSSAALSVDASSTTKASWGSTSLVTGVNLQRDDKGHVTGVTVDSIQMPSNPNSHYTTQNIVAGSATATTQTTAALANGNVFINHLENSGSSGAQVVKSSTKISGTAPISVTTNTSGAISVSVSDLSISSKGVVAQLPTKTESGATVADDQKVLGGAGEWTNIEVVFNANDITF